MLKLRERMFLMRTDTLDGAQEPVPTNEEFFKCVIPNIVYRNAVKGTGSFPIVVTRVLIIDLERTIDGMMNNSR